MKLFYIMIKYWLQTIKIGVVLLKGQSISIQQIKDVAGKLIKRECEPLYVPDLDQLIIVVKEDMFKVSKLKGIKAPPLSIEYLEEYAVFIINIYLSLEDMSKEEELITIPLPINSDILGYLEKVAYGNNSIEINIISEDLTEISSRHYFNKSLLKDAVAREVDKVKFVGYERNK